MIKEAQPLSMAEVLEYAKKEKKDEVMGFIKKFTSMDEKKAKELRSKLQELNIIKMKPEHIVKIIDILPEDSEDINKIFSDVTLTEDEIKKILETVKQYI